MSSGALRTTRAILMRMATLRPFSRHYSAFPFSPSDIHVFAEAEHPKLAWLELRQLTDDHAAGIKLFTGTITERRALHTEFRNYVRQAETYWRAAEATPGSASALLYYYGALNLAKAELLQSSPARVFRQFPRHGLRLRASQSTSIRGDHLEVGGGVFSMLYEKRTGSTLGPRHRFRVTNLLALIPEIGYEVDRYGRSRPSTRSGYHTVASDDSQAWSLIMMDLDATALAREPSMRALQRHYELVDLNTVPLWRTFFAMSTRTRGASLGVFQSKQTFATVDPTGAVVPDHARAQRHPRAILGEAVNPALRDRADFYWSQSVTKSDALTVPLGLTRYACMFYLSSLVRYKPSSLDPQHEGLQSWLMDSFVTEVSMSLIWDAVSGITGNVYGFEPNQFRI